VEQVPQRWALKAQLAAEVSQQQFQAALGLVDSILDQT
jgi:hypothetical protein